MDDRELAGTLQQIHDEIVACRIDLDQFKKEALDYLAAGSEDDVLDDPSDMEEEDEEEEQEEEDIGEDAADAAETAEDAFSVAPRGPKITSKEVKRR